MIDPGLVDILGKLLLLTFYSRLFKQVAGPYALIGGSIALSYTLIIDFLRHHEETNNDRPYYFDHMFALTVIGGAIGLFQGGMPRHAFVGAWVGGMCLAPFGWFIHKHARLNAQNRPTNIFYQNDVTKEDVERIQHIDEMETIAFMMRAQPGYGYFKHLTDPRH